MIKLRYPQLNAAQPITEGDDTMAQHFRTRMNDLQRFMPIVGEGSPEGIIEAPLYASYIDANGATGAIRYIKMQDNVAGDRTQGWILE